MKLTGGMDFIRASKEMKEVKDIMEQSNEISAMLDKSAEALFSPFAEISPDIKATKETVINDTAKMRSPEILHTRISMALIESDFNAGTWENASATERIQMMDKMFDIMMEEMQIPDKVRKNLHLLHSGTESRGGNMVVAGHCNRFVSENEYGKLALLEKPVVEMHYRLMYQDFDTALGALYNQAIKVMQQSTCLEPEGTYPDLSEQLEWEAEVRNLTNGDSPLSKMQQFAVKAEKQMLDRYHSILKHKGTTTKAISFK